MMCCRRACLAKRPSDGMASESWTSAWTALASACHGSASAVTTPRSDCSAMWSCERALNHRWLSALRAGATPYGLPAQRAHPDRVVEDVELVVGDEPRGVERVQPALEAAGPS